LNWLPGAWVALVLVATVVVCLRLERKAEAFARALEQALAPPLQLSAEERLVQYNDWIDQAISLREQADLMPRALGRVCLMSGVGLGILQAAGALTEPGASGLAGVISLSGGLTGLGAGFLFGSLIRSTNRRISEKIRALRGPWVGALSGPGRSRRN